MAETPPKASGLLIAGAALLALLVAYIAGFYLCGTTNLSSGGAQVHFYRWHWQVIFFTPATKVESLVIGRETYAVSMDD